MTLIYVDTEVLKQIMNKIHDAKDRLTGVDFGLITQKTDLAKCDMSDALRLLKNCIDGEGK